MEIGDFCAEVTVLQQQKIIKRGRRVHKKSVKRRYDK